MAGNPKDKGKGGGGPKGGGKPGAPKSGGGAKGPAAKAPAAAQPAPQAGVAAKATPPVAPKKAPEVGVGGSAAPQAGAAERATAAHEATPRAITRHGFKRKLLGRVKSDKMDKTVTVEVIRNALDPVYKKYVRMRERYKAHDETNQYKTGDRVEITEHRPISRDKRWIVSKLIARPVEE